MPEESPLPVRDHDLLIRLDQKVDGLTEAIKRIEDNAVARLNKLEADHVSRKEFDDHEKRLRHLEEKRIPRIENRLSYWAGALAVAQAVIAYVMARFFGKN